MFGREDIGRGESAPLPRLDSAPAAPAGSFTQMFGQSPSAPPERPSQSSQLGAATLGTSPNVRASFQDSSSLNPTPAPTPPPPLADSFFSRTPTPGAPPVNQPVVNRAASMTDAFRMPTADAPPIEQAPSGPSEFTVFLSRSQLNASLASQPAAASGTPAGSAQMPAFAPPPVPEPGFHFAPTPPNCGV